MKRLLFLFVALIAINAAFSQTPLQFKYQAVLRDASGNVISSQAKTVVINILQGSAAGTSVFTETQNITTTAQGLINLNIGSVNTTGLGAIDWAANIYFIRITVGGVEMGTSQLLTVPYALNAKKAETADYNSLTNLPSLFNGTWSSLTGKPDFATVATSGSYTDLSNKPTTDGSETKITAGTNITVTGSGTDASPYVINSNVHFIGESYGGGIVFYVYDNGKHGLIASTTDQGIIIYWYNGPNATVNSVRDGINAGIYNTERIIANQGTGSYAAQLCANYKGGNFGDWYLPSQYELNLLYLQKSAVGGFDDSRYYWSSTETNSTYAYCQLFSNGLQNTGNKATFTASVRAIRAF